MKYTAINIGPIVSTLSMARNSRELWAASFLFSHLMKCIYAEAEKTSATIISPAKPTMDKNKVGIYPDRIYVRGEMDAKMVVSNAALEFFSNIHKSDATKEKVIDLSYFNLMSTSCETDKEADAIRTLNQQLDVLELCNYATDGNAAKTIYEIISDKKQCPLFQLSIGNFWRSIPDIETMAKAQLLAHKDIKIKSHHKYFCVVQADGDNVGKTVSHQGLKEGKVMEISKQLVQFGENATTMIENFGGVPIYAGGDDLLFLAPVIGKDGTNIFGLLDKLENKAFKGVHDEIDNLHLKDDKGNEIQASLSFGVSINYYKYPLYEALESARNLLFDKAKQIEKKKAVAWSLRKHSGGTFEAVFSLKDTQLKQKFEDLIAATMDGSTVSAIAHKIREEETLVDIVLSSKEQDRLDALFKKILEFDDTKADYFNAIKDIMPILYDSVEKEKFIQALYSLSRTAKFIKGEDLHDE